jgi:leucyl/phenylalanyl-tRNA---protein transferase
VTGFTRERRYFPDPHYTLADGLVMVGGELNLETLLEAYSFGIFPWPHEDYPLLWFSPVQRGVLDFANLHWPRSFQKFLRQHAYRLTCNLAFADVMAACSQVPRPGQNGTWITPEISAAYLEFHRAGYAHSVECWEGDVLVGGLYGVYVAGVFAGESMFFHKPNTSKLCLWWLIERLRDQGHSWMDTQMVTENLKTLGGCYIKRDEFLERLEVAKQNWKPLALS